MTHSRRFLVSGGEYIFDCRPEEEIFMVNMNYQHTINLALIELQKRDPAEIARLSGCDWDAELNRLLVPFLGRTYIVNSPRGPVQDPEGKEIPLTTQILILHYLLNAKGTPLTGQWISYKELPGGSIYIGPFTARSIAPMTRVFGTKPAKLKEAAERIGARPFSKGDVGVILQALPRIPVALVLWAADEEFPASGNILFDGAAADYLPTEDYAVLAQSIVFYLKGLAF